MESLATRPRTTLLPCAVCAAVTAALALLLQSMNSGVYAFLGNSDPQGYEQIFDMLYTDVITRHTSGYAYGMVVALILGALLARFGPAAICGTLLGIINAGVAFAAGGSTVVSMSPEQYGTVSGSLRLDLLATTVSGWLSWVGGRLSRSGRSGARHSAGSRTPARRCSPVDACSRRRCSPVSSSGTARERPERSWRSCYGHRLAAPAS
jgi:hypothetical protein